MVWIDRTGGGLPENVPMMLVAAVLGVAVFGLLAAAFSGITPNAELAQVAVLPVLIVALVGSPARHPAVGDALRRQAGAHDADRGDDADGLRRWLLGGGAALDRGAARLARGRGAAGEVAVPLGSQARLGWLPP
ncbi:hypothetical protein [Nonomuraea dietziae]|uniref:hypothetical protein n=1 Tax=Nonomuraea dietziae TaxID=65515 RepID=UPI0031D7A1A7